MRFTRHESGRRSPRLPPRGAGAVCVERRACRMDVDRDRHDDRGIFLPAGDALHGKCSFVVPVTALSYAAGAIGAALFLREKISKQRWLGVLVVCLGVTLVWLSRR